MLYNRVQEVCLYYLILFEGILWPEIVQVVHSIFELGVAMASLVLWVTLLVWLVPKGPPVGALTACNCDLSIKTEMYSLFKSEACQRDEEPTREVRNATFVERGDTIEVEGFRCSGLVTRTSFLCNTLSYNYLTSAAATSPLRLSVQDCIMAATRGLCTLQIGDRATAVKVSVDASVPFRASNTGDFPNEDRELYTSYQLRDSLRYHRDN